MCKTKYDAEQTPQLAKQYSRDGLIESEIATKLGIAESTLYEWKNKYPEFAEAIKEGKPVVDSKVEDSLLRRAMGYEYEETKIIATKDGKATRVEKTKKFIPPDVTAQIFWLKNRQPEKWRDTSHQEITGKDGGPIETRTTTTPDLSSYTNEELAQMRAINEAADARRNQEGTGTA
jgi:transposase-like protein